MSISESITLEPIASRSGLTDRDWRKILRDIHDGKVIPVIGPELVAIPALQTCNAVLTVI